MLLKRLILQICGLGLFCWLLAVGESGIVKHFFHTAKGIHPAPMVWLPSKGLRDLEWLIFAFILLRVKLQTLSQPNCQR